MWNSSPVSKEQAAGFTEVRQSEFNQSSGVFEVGDKAGQKVQTRFSEFVFPLPICRRNKANCKYVYSMQIENSLASTIWEIVEGWR
ncbi:TPA: hypothetical protein U1248_001044 [Streptococcus suis]|nr:hypothetical protein [Streptococcus suis]HEM5110779.1 hypothetical protein [Streptococcus suis]